MKLLAVTPLGRNWDKSRLRIETRRIDPLVFPPGTPYMVEARGEELVLRPSNLAENHVSSRRTTNGLCPIIDLADQAYLGPLGEFQDGTEDHRLVRAPSNQSRPSGSRHPAKPSPAPPVPGSSSVRGRRNPDGRPDRQ